MSSCNVDRRCRVRTRAAVLLCDGNIVAAAHEERFTRKKHDDRFPLNAIEFVLNEAGINIEELSLICFYDKPILKFERLLETYHAFAPAGLKSFLMAMPVWLKEKIFSFSGAGVELFGLSVCCKCLLIFYSY